MSTHPLIRNATSTDEPDILALLEASGLPRDGVHEAMSGFVIAEAGGRIVGSAAVEICGDSGVNGLLRSVAVDETVRGQGIGRALVEHAIESARRQGLIDLYLLTTTAETYFPAYGFLPTTRDAVPDDVKENVEFQSACPASAAVMVLPLVGA